MAFYSFVVLSSRPLVIEVPAVMLDTGVNAFNVVVDDLEALLRRFEEEGVEVREQYRLDGLEPIEPLVFEAVRELWSVEEVEESDGT